MASTRRWFRGLGTLLLLLAVGMPGLHAEDAAEDEPATDVMAAALEVMGIAEADLGYRPKAHWARYPHPRTVPHVLPFFEDLLAAPLDTYAFVRSFADPVEDGLTPEGLQAAPTTKDKKEGLFQLGVALATDRRIGGFRGYASNLDPRPEATDPLRHALLHLLTVSGTPDVRPVTFGAPDEAQDPRAAIEAQVRAVPAALHRPMAHFILDLVDAKHWIDLGLRHVTPAQRREVFATLTTLTEDTPDGTRYHPVLDDVARVVDEHSLHYGCLKALQATQNARRRFGAVDAPEGGWSDIDLCVSTAWGTVAMIVPNGQPTRVEDPFLVVLPENGSSLDGPIGATSPTRSLSVVLMLDAPGRVGTPIGMGTRQAVHAEADVASGVLGCGIAYSAGTGRTTWKTGRWGLGAGLFGLGALIDEGGDDIYQARSAAQGAAFFGAGLLLDAAGDDIYELWEGDGQGYGGPGGIGVLADRSGNDRYVSEPDASKAGRADYHSKHEIAVSNAQGVGSGRRGDGSDGHVWAGGLGALIDVDGNDHYTAGNFSQGLGYWYGTGFLWDGGGDDTYESVYFTQGSGAHFAVGALIDESGNDVHRLGNNAGAAFGFGWDVVNAMLLDRGQGNDRYEAKIISTGLAEVRSNAFFLDEGGDDVYVLDAGTKGFGDVDARASYAKPGRRAHFPFLLDQVGVFLDLGGTDRYLRRAKDGTLEPDPAARDGGRWNERRFEGVRGAGRPGANVSVGMDVVRGRLGFLDAWPARTTD